MTLPPGWAVAEFGEVVRIESDLVDPATAPEAPHIAPNHIESGTGRLLDYTTVQNDGVTSAKHRFHAGQVLYSKIRPYLAKAVLVDFDGLCSADMYPLSPETSVLDARFLHRWLLSETFTSRVCQDQGRTVLPKVNQAALSKIPVPLPPLAEQKRIVAKLEELTARSRRAKEALDAVPPLLDQLRQSILAAAFRGDLTADWRERNPDVEPGEKLLARIHAERRSRWEVRELATLTAKGRRPTDDKWKLRYQEPAPKQQEHLPPLPPGWCWASVDDVTFEAKIGLVRSTGEQGPIGVPYIRMQHFDQFGKWRLEDVTRVAVTHEELREFSLADGDLLFNTRNSADLVGKVALWTGERSERHVFNNNLMRMRMVLALSRWAAHQMISPRFREQLSESISATTSIAAIYGRDLFRQSLCVPPDGERQLALTRLSSLLHSIEGLSQSALEAGQKLELLDRAALARAFRGELVPQDPNDEPSTELLERSRHTRGSLRVRGGAMGLRSRETAPLELDASTNDAKGGAGIASTERLTIYNDTLHDEVFTALWTLGTVETQEATHRVADRLRAAGRIHFDDLHPNTPLHAQILAAIDSAVAANHLDRPLPNHVRAIKPDPTSYTPDDWHHILVTTLPATPTDRDTAIRTAAEYARDNLGLAFSRLRSDGHIVQALRSAITTAIRRGEVLRHGPTKISLAPSDSPPRTRRS